MIHTQTVDPFEFLPSTGYPTSTKNVGPQHLQFNLLHVSETFDPHHFRKTVQAKIKEKYQHSQSKHYPKNILKTLQIEPSEGSDRQKRLIGLHSEAIDKSITKEELPQFTHTKKTNSLEKLINKKHHIFLNTSNLFSPSVYARERKSLNPNTKIKVGMLTKTHEKSEHQVKHNHIYQYNKISSFNYGNEPNKSMMRLEETQPRTVPEEAEDKE
jgi:hypothetical protein